MPAALRIASIVGVCARGAARASRPPSALAVPKVTLHAGFNPERLGLSTTVDLRILIAPGAEPIPPPLDRRKFAIPPGSTRN